MYEMKGKTIRLGLVGKDVSASTSHRIHRFVLGELGYTCEYEKISVSAEEFDLAARRLLGDFDGFNVTIPYKRDIMEYLDEVVGDAFSFGAVNTVCSATRKGYNTDGVGFMLMLRLAGIAVQGKKTLVLGGGGAGRSCAAAIKQAGGNVFLYQRNRARLMETANELGVRAVDAPYGEPFDILINATGVGMHDTVGVSPVDERAFEGASYAVDLIYHPAKSAFLTLAEKQGLQILNGAAMLFYQAYYADCLFLGLEPSEEQAKEFYKKYEKQNGGRL